MYQLAPTFGATCVDERALEVRQRQPGSLAPGLELSEVASPQEEALIAVRVCPLCGRCHEPAVHADVVPRGVDPPPQPCPLAEQRFVCDLERGRPRTGVAVEGEKARCAEGVDRLRHRLLVELDRSELSVVDAPAGVFDPLSERDQSQEELPRRVLGRFAQACVDLVGVSGQCSRDSTDLVIGSTRENTSFTVLVQLGQGVLEQGQRPGLVCHVGDHLRE